MRLRRARPLIFLLAPLLPACSCGDSSQVDASGAANDGGARSDAIPDATTEAQTPQEAGNPTLVVSFGRELRPGVRRRVEALLRASSTQRPVVVIADDAKPKAPAPGSFVLGFGDTAVARALVADGDVRGAGAEGFVLRSGAIDGVQALVERGNGLDPDALGQGNIGAAFGAYALLEELGFAFLHPLAPLTPTTLPMAPAAVARSEHPYWPLRLWHIHTQHPLELTDLLNGFGPAGPADASGWEAMLPEWERLLEWLLANRQNRVEWALLWAASWQEFGDGPLRKARLARLVQLAHDYGIAVGVDVPLALEQQHAFRLVRTQGAEADERAQIRTNVQWLLDVGFDFLSTETGTTEFTHADPARTLVWMNEFASAASGHPTYIKAHCSAGQTAAGYSDPTTGQPINYNFLVHYADPALGVMPHTVQHYALDDPAPTYNNKDFGYVREFLQEEVGTREVVFFPESAYWVSFDIDVPLFLPVYAERRLHDLRLLAGDEKAGRMGRGAHAGGRMGGQMVFSSGWEWGYWVNDVVTARAAWDPQLATSDDAQALRKAFFPVARVFGAQSAAVAELLARTAEAERTLLILGNVNGKTPNDISKRNGQAYLQGVETWDDVSELGNRYFGTSMTQPARLGLVDLRNPAHAPPDYATEVEPLLSAMERSFTALATEYRTLAGSASAEARPLLDELADAARMTALRAIQVHGLYDYVDAYSVLDSNNRGRQARLATARAALDEATTIVAGREAKYRVPAERVAGWTDGPTAYGFRYLWTVRSLAYFWRDEGKAVDVPSSANPCYQNFINPAEVAMGEGTATSLIDLLGQVNRNTPIVGGVANCSAGPTSEPKFPQYDRTRN